MDTNSDKALDEVEKAGQGYLTKIQKLEAECNEQLLTIIKDIEHRKIDDLKNSLNKL